MDRRKITRKKHGGAIKAMWYGPAMRMFVEDEMTHAAISEKTGVPYHTIRSWSAKGKWKKLREEFRQSSVRTVTQAKLILQDIIKRMNAKREAKQDITAAEVDQMAKVAVTIERLDTIITPRRAFVIFASRFAIWCKEMHPDDQDFLARMSDAVQGYGGVILETDGHA